MTEILFLNNKIIDMISFHETRSDIYLHDCEPIDYCSNFASLLSACLHATLIAFSPEKIIIGLPSKLITIKYQSDTGDGLFYNTLFSISINSL